MPLAEVEVESHPEYQKLLSRVEDLSPLYVDRIQKPRPAINATVTALRPPPGTRALERVPLCSNLFAMELPPHTVLFRYKVTVLECPGAGRQDKDLCKGAANE